MTRHLNFPEAIGSVEFSPTGHLLIARSLDNVFFRALASGRNRTLPGLRVTHALNLRGDAIAVSSEEGIKITPLFEPNKILWYVPMPRFVRAAFSPDGTHLLLLDNSGIYPPVPQDEQICLLDIRGKRAHRLSRWIADLRQRLKPYGQTLRDVALRGWHKDRGVLLRLVVSQETPKVSEKVFVCWLDPFRDALVGKLVPVDEDYTQAIQGRYLVRFRYPARTDQVTLAYTDLRTGDKVKVTSFPWLQGGSDEGVGLSCAKDALSAVVFGARRLSGKPNGREYQGYIWLVDLLKKEKRLLVSEPQNTYGMDEDIPLVNAALSPDGKRMAFITGHNQRRVRIVNVG